MAAALALAVLAALVPRPALANDGDHTYTLSVRNYSGQAAKVAWHSDDGYNVTINGGTDGSAVAAPGDGKGNPGATVTLAVHTEYDCENDGTGFWVALPGETLVGTNYGYDCLAGTSATASSTGSTASHPLDTDLVFRTMAGTGAPVAADSACIDPVTVSGIDPTSGHMADTVDISVRDQAGRSCGGDTRAYDGIGLAQGGSNDTVDDAGIDASWAHIEAAHLHGIDLAGANLEQALLNDTDMSGADLSRADAKHAQVDGANLSGANLTAADFYNAQFRSADFSNANLTLADLRLTNVGASTVNGTTWCGTWLQPVPPPGQPPVAASRRYDSCPLHAMLTITNGTAAPLELDSYNDPGDLASVTYASNLLAPSGSPSAQAYAIVTATSPGQTAGLTFAEKKDGPPRFDAETVEPVAGQAPTFHPPWSVGLRVSAKQDPDGDPTHVDLLVTEG